MSKNKQETAFNRKWLDEYPVRPKTVSKRDGEKLPIPRGPRTKKPGDSLYDIVRYTTRFLLDLRDNYGKAASFYINGQLYIGLFSPKMVTEVYTTKQNLFIKGIGVSKLRKLAGDGLLTSEDPVHKRHRRMMQPPFHKNKIDSYINDMYNVTVQHLENWEGKTTVELSPEMMKLTLKVVSKTLFSTDADKYAEKMSKNLDIAIDRVATTMLPSTTLLDNSPLPWFGDYRKASETLSEITDEIINERREGVEQYDDLLNLLIDLADENGEKFTNEELRDEALTILLSGHETTATLLVWMLTRINTKPELLKKLQEEADNAVWIKEKRPPSMSEILETPIAAKIIKETLRLNPPLWFIMRQALEDMTIDGAYIPKGTNVFISQYITHRDPEFFKNPKEWDPDRWDDDLESKLPKGAYFPFGYGARKCIGEQFALIETRILLLYIIHNYTIKSTNAERAVPKVKPRASLRAKGNVPVYIQKRTP